MSTGTQGTYPSHKNTFNDPEPLSTTPYVITWSDFYFDNITPNCIADYYSITCVDQTDPDPAQWKTVTIDEDNAETGTQGGCAAGSSIISFDTDYLTRTITISDDMQPPGQYTFTITGWKHDKPSINNSFDIEITFYPGCEKDN